MRALVRAPELRSGIHVDPRGGLRLKPGEVSSADLIRGDLMLGEPRPEEESPRPFRGALLREILDEEYSRNYRFEGFSDLLQDLKGFLRNVMDRDEDPAMGGDLFRQP